ncbi:MAG: cytochrome c biogenesis protein CcdA [Chloroflexi bacterium]|nr:cytochrome c biogenesis protein CcdA [Chloroflexota bacterium]
MSVGLLILAFGAGLLSCLSPCVLPLMPAYVGYLSGAVATPEGVMIRRRETLLHAFTFVLGFTTIFVAIWSALSALSVLLSKTDLSHIAGVILIVFGIHLTGLMRIPLLYREARVNFQSSQLGLPRSYLTGMAFAAGWTPCIGPMLSFILALATQTNTAVEGTVLLLFYSAGLGVPFLLTALGLDVVQRKIKGMNRFLHFVEIAGGALLITMGLLLVFDKFQILNAYFFRLTPQGLYDVEGWFRQWLGVQLPN